MTMMLKSEQLFNFFLVSAYEIGPWLMSRISMVLLYFADEILFRFAISSISMRMYISRHTA